MEGKNEWPKPRKFNDTKEDIPTQVHKAKSFMFKTELLTQLTDFQIFPTIFGRYPDYFLITSLKGIAYAFIVSSSLGRIRPIKFNEP